MSISALLLAAGGSRRFGEAKQLVDWGGRPLLRHVLEQVRSWPVDQVVVVLGHRVEEILDRVDLDDTTVVVNPEWETGLASSLRVGLAALERDPRAEAAIIALGDQPEVDPGVVRRLVEAYRRRGRWAVVPKYRYVRANPVLVDRALWTRLMSLRGDDGARQLLQAHPEWVEEVWVDRLPPRDVDTPGDLADLRPSIRGRRPPSGS
ncbi:MAG: nucleotidyltransferase family protein [Actinomycetota bacterium]|nr:nucleotidyltransferase family protein [Actinomycetota bacterium]